MSIETWIRSALPWAMNSVGTPAATFLSAVPIPDPEVEARRERIVLTGDVPSPDQEITGCAFRTRCPKAFDRCAVEAPLLAEHRRDHKAACFLHEE